MSKASKLVTDALLGDDTATVIVAGQTYFVDSPTIERIAKAASHLDSLEGGNTFGDMIGMMKHLEDSCKALSVFIKGDETLSGELSKGTPQEVVEGLKSAISLISIQSFCELSTLAKSVARMVANPRP